MIVLLFLLLLQPQEYCDEKLKMFSSEALREFAKVPEEVKKETKVLLDEIGTIQKKCKEYGKVLDKIATREELEEFKKSATSLEEIVKELEAVQEKGASEEIVIQFVGATSSGKSSLINTLLRSKRLPVAPMQTTMCSIKVCTTKEKEWSVTTTGVNGETVCLSKTRDEKAINRLLSQVSDKKHSDERENLNICASSVVQVNWPEHLCTVLPLNVALVDTPGFGEKEEWDKVVTESSKKADIIVAVMDAMSPSAVTVSKIGTVYIGGVWTGQRT